MEIKANVAVNLRHTWTPFLIRYFTINCTLGNESCAVNFILPSFIRVGWLLR